MKTDAKPKARPASWKGEFYRQSRAWHGYLSAVAFLALTFFAVTGLLLNHPEWTPNKGERPTKDQTLTLPGDALSRARTAADPGRALAAEIGQRARLLGAFQSGEIVDDQALVRLEGPRGSTDITVDMATGAAEVSVEPARLVDTLNDLHRGKNAGKVWKLVIDLTAVVVLALSVIGYLLFFSLRFRLRTSLLLTVASLLVLVGVVLGLTP
ncbi:PepSY-associated TM helix domain-containing protein [Phenylobacterium sp. LjRoot225]|uniref:PepSY-associated TM helix domain-containing protein n=1 Tax=Phenylobacterium sp. LjRoot225 TaxID=3342285 RepID=UPI003ECEFE92